MTPAEKRKRTIMKRYGSYKAMLSKRDKGDLILGGYNGGIKKVPKGFAKWDKDKIKAFANRRERDKHGRFIREADR